MDPSYFWQIPLLFAIGIIAGLLNVLAGGGSLITLPLLIFLGLPTAVANGTNRIAIFLQNFFAIQGFHKHGYLPLDLALLCTPPAIIGSFLGAELAVTMDDQLFKRVLAIIMVGVLVFTAIDPMKRLRAENITFTSGRKALLIISFFGVGLYGGFVQVGVGFIVIAALLLHGLDLVRINAIKVFVVFVYTIITLAVFIYHDQVNSLLGFALGAGNAIGGMLGPRLAIEKGHDWIKKVVTVTVLIFAIKLFIRP